jgi:hypothetical protein
MLDSAGRSKSVTRFVISGLHHFRRVNMTLARHLLCDSRGYGLHVDDFDTGALGPISSRTRGAQSRRGTVLPSRHRSVQPLRLSERAILVRASSNVRNRSSLTPSPNKPSLTPDDVGLALPVSANASRYPAIRIARSRPSSTWRAHGVGLIFAIEARWQGKRGFKTECPAQLIGQVQLHRGLGEP